MLPIALSEHQASLSYTGESPISDCSEIPLIYFVRLNRLYRVTFRETVVAPRGVHWSPMPLNLNGYTAHISSDKKELEAYGIQHEDDKTVSCWIASEEGKVTLHSLPYLVPH